MNESIVIMFAKSKKARRIPVMVIAIAVALAPPVVPLRSQMLPLSFAAVGVSTAFALDKADEKATDLINKAGYEMSLTSAKAAQDLQILISNARQSLHEELNDNWNIAEGKRVDKLPFVSDDPVLRS